MTDSKEILYIGGFELPDKNAAAQRVIANGKVFRDLGYSVTYLGPDRSLIGNVKLKQESGIFEGFKFYRTKYPDTLFDWSAYLFSIRAVVVLMDAMPGLSMVIAYNYPAIALYRLNLICKSRGISLVSDCTEWYQPDGNLIHKTIKGVDTSLRMHIIHPKLDGVIAISKYLYEFYHARMTNVLQLPPLVDMNADKWANPYIDDNDELVLVYAGSPGKGSKDRIDLILKMLSIIKSTSNIKLLLNVIGLSRQQYVEDFGEEYIEGDMDAVVIFKGRLSHIETLNEVKKGDYAILIRDSNLLNTAGFPTKFVEALSCGTPVLSNAYSNVFDYLQDGYNGYRLDSSDEESLLRSLVFALSQGKNKVREMKANIRKDEICDYRNFLIPVRDFLNVVNNKTNGKSEDNRSIDDK